MYVRYRHIRETMDQRVVCSNNKRNRANKRAEDCTALAGIFTQQLHGGQAPVIGLYSDYEKDEHGSYLFTAGQFADQQIEHVKEIPASTYARFRTRKDRLKRSCLKHGTRFGRGISVNTALIQVILNGMMKDLLIQKKRKLTFILRLMKK